MKVLIVEDEMLVAEDLSDYLQEAGFSICGIAISGEECFSSMEQNKPDAVILDIALKGKMDGTQVAALLNKTKIPFVFLTANCDDATVKKAMAVKPAAFITKPFNKRDVSIALELLHQKITGEHLSEKEKISQHFLFVREGNVYKRIQLQDILFVEARGSYSRIVTPEKSYTLAYNLSYFQQKVSNPIFRRVHRSYIVNTLKVDGFDACTLRIQKSTIPVSRQYQKELLDLFVKL
ncbi:MAG: response regulator [Bacteroidia bacterium]|nr:response regulator [Bacteroidia bacterium]